MITSGCNKMALFKTILVNRQISIAVRSFSLSSKNHINFLPNFITPKPRVAVIDLAGPIQADGGAFFGRNQKLNINSLEKSIEKAFSFKRLQSVLLNINSPGGSPVQSELIAKKIIRLGKQKNIKVISFVEDVAASGGYWLACAGDEIYTSNNSIIGSIGVISARFGMNEFLQQHGVDWRVHTAGKAKSFLDPFQPEKKEDVEKLKVILNEMHDYFKNYVKDRRGGRLRSHDDVLFNGDIWLGQRAIEHGLVDGINDVNSYIQERFGTLGKDVRVIRVNKKKRGFMDSFLYQSFNPMDVNQQILADRFKVV